MAKTPIPPAVYEALAVGNKIEAIKRLRGITGLGLKEAKDWIESYERGGEPAPLPVLEHLPERNPNASFTLPPAALEALKRGNAVEAIKIVRDATGVGLAEAKSIVDEIQKSMPDVGFARSHTEASVAGTGLGPGQVAPDASMGKWVALIAVLAIVIISMAMYYR